MDKLKPVLVGPVEAIVDPETVELLADLLEKAKTGAIRSIAVASTTPGGGRNDYNCRVSDLPHLLMHLGRLDRTLRDRFFDESKHGE